MDSKRLQINLARVPILLAVMLGLTKSVDGSFFSLSIVASLNYVQQLLVEIGPMLSAMLFVVAGIFYAIGQLLPYEKKASFHVAAVNIIIGAIVVAVLSFASSGLALASTHFLSNLTTNGIT